MINIIRTEQEPECLAEERAKTNGSYNCPGVVAQLAQDFNRKCYLCEDKSTANETEHLVPHRGGMHLALKFDWHNLFLSCRHCNSVKNGFQQSAPNPILDCARTGFEIDERILHKISFSGADGRIAERVFFESAYGLGEADPLVLNTIELLNQIFSLQPTGPQYHKELNAANLVEDLSSKLADLMQLIEKDLLSDDDFADPVRAEQRIRRHLQADSVFAAFKRQLVREYAAREPRLEPLLRQA